MSDKGRGMAWVPLQRALKSWMGESGQRLVDARTEPAQLSDQLRGHILQAGQRLPLDIVEQAYTQGLAVQVQRQQLLPGTCSDYGGHR
ncbi:hypothetical protein D3C72_1304960 [compost metagenome]